ncbi:MAG: toll/interleukin-1 receptor domain-containing protein [Lachnospira sp.]|nr:toll/interleukin-1 receptor domain-containing protein [Lachnospira sp.]
MDVFISYRRNTGASQAALLKEKLMQKGIDVFFDTNSIHNEDFLEKIKSNIDKAPNFLMIVTPGYFKKREGVEDYVREEILYAQSKHKNIIAISFSGYNHDEVDWDNEIDEIKVFKTFNLNEYPNSSEEMEEVFIKTQIINRMKDSNGRKFSLKKKSINNSWYADHEMTDEDRLWITSDHEVCKKLDWKMLERAIKEKGLFEDKKELSLFVYKAYDIDTYKKKYDLSPERNVRGESPRISNVYGVTYASYVNHANDVFGEGHFIDDEFDDKDYDKKIMEIMENNNLLGFDIIDLTLVIKDVSNPEKLVSKMANYINPNGGIIYIRDLDDDYVDAYPDNQKLIDKMCNLLELDDGAGNRHIGKKIYTFLKKSGADKVYVSDEVISTANHKPAYQKKICDTYFSYLKPELKALAEPTDKNKEHKNYKKFVEAADWLNDNYDDVESLFRSTEFYFRAGYVAGYGVFYPDEE